MLFLQNKLLILIKWLIKFEETVTIVSWQSEYKKSGYV